jgi:hypothetical protein
LLRPELLPADVARELRPRFAALVLVLRFAVARVFRFARVLADFRALLADFFLADAVRDRVEADLRFVPEVLPDDRVERPLDLRLGNRSLGTESDA